MNWKRSMRLSWLVTALVALPTVAVPALGQRPASGSIAGRVIDIASGEPLAAANIVVEGTVLGAAADANGRFSIRGLTPGKYTLLVSMIGYRTERPQVEIYPSSQINVEIRLRQTVINFNPVVVTASKRSQRLETSTSSIEMLSGQEIEARNHFVLNDALAEVPGVNFMEESINIRGSSGYSRGIGSRVSVLVDGVPVNSVDMDGTDWNILPVLAVDRAEVVKGALSALYGSDATGGVVNLVTQTPSSHPTTRIFAIAGAYDKPYTDTFKWTDRLLRYDGLELSHSRRFGRLGLFASVGRHESTGYRQNGHYQRTKVSGKVTYSFGNASRLTLFGTWIKEKRGEFIQWLDQNHPFLVPESDFNNRVNLNHVFVYARYDWPLSSRLLLHLRSSLNSALLGNQFAISGEFNPGQGFGNEIQITYLPPGHVVTLGGSYRYAKADSKFWQGLHEENAYALYLQDEANLFLPNLNLTVGARLDRHTISNIEEQQLNPKIGLNYRPFAGTTLRGSVGKGFRYPSVVERFVKINFGGFNIVENRELRPETAWTKEVSVRQHLNRDWFVEASVFQNDYKDFIQAVADASGTVQFQNVNKARIRGIELATRGAWLRGLFSLWAGLTLIDPKDLETGRTLIYRRKVVLNLLPSVNVGPVEIGARYLYGSRVDEVEIYPLDQRVPQKQLDSFLTWRWGNFEISFEVRNLLNYHYTQIERNMREIRNLRTVLRANF